MIRCLWCKVNFYKAFLTEQFFLFCLVSFLTAVIKVINICRETRFCWIIEDKNIWGRSRRPSVSSPFQPQSLQTKRGLPHLHGPLRRRDRAARRGLSCGWAESLQPKGGGSAFPDAASVSASSGGGHASEWCSWNQSLQTARSRPTAASYLLGMPVIWAFYCERAHACSPFFLALGRWRWSGTWAGEIIKCLFLSQTGRWCESRTSLLRRLTSWSGSELESTPAEPKVRPLPTTPTLYFTSLCSRGFQKKERSSCQKPAASFSCLFQSCTIWAEDGPSVCSENKTRKIKPFSTIKPRKKWTYHKL